MERDTMILTSIVGSLRGKSKLAIRGGPSPREGISQDGKDTTPHSGSPHMEFALLGSWPCEM